MTERQPAVSIGDRELDRLLALAPPPPTAPPGLADRIAARAAATTQLPPLPPRRVPRLARIGQRRRRTLAGAVLGSFVLAVAAAAAVLGGHVDLQRLATLPVMLFDRHPGHAAMRAPARSAASTPSPTAAIATTGGTVQPPAQNASALPPARGGGRLANVPAAAVRTGLAGLAHPPIRSIEIRNGKRAIAARQHDHHPATMALKKARASAVRREAPSLVKEDGAAEANREALRATERATAQLAEHDSRPGERVNRLGTRADEGIGQRWRARGQAARWRDHFNLSPRAPGAGEPGAEVAAGHALPAKDIDHRKPRHRGPPPGKKRGRWR